MLKNLQYILANTDIPHGHVSSTARKGDKWFNQVVVGNVVNLEVTENKASLGQAVIVGKELVTYKDVLENADHNHVAYGTKVKNGIAPDVALAEALTAAYGDLKPDDVFTILHILPLEV